MAKQKITAKQIKAGDVILHNGYTNSVSNPQIKSALLGSKFNMQASVTTVEPAEQKYKGLKGVIVTTTYGVKINFSTRQKVMLINQ